MLSPLSPEWRKRIENAQTFLRIPPAEMPNPLMCRALMERALAGHHCFAYHPSPRGPWLIWDRPDKAARQPQHSGGFRYTIREWAVAHGYLPADSQ